MAPTLYSCGMDATPWSRIEALFHDALARPEEEREDFVRAASGGDVALVRDVLALLDAEAAPAAILAGRALDVLPVEAADLFAPEADAGRRVGPYRLVEEVGRGGMGAVFRAERADGAFDQTVALKLVKRGMDSEAVLRRFRAERRILARLDHPGIARILDGGLADDGRPYLAMEFVEGEPITDHCDRLGLDLGARVRLFLQVCEAVGYAHRQLVVHRDLKPSNVLVTPEGRVKLLDFGIAKVLAGDEADDPMTVLTGPGQMLLTPEYAAPEQVTGAAISTATDVYALGVILYEVLSGQRPYAFDARTPAVIEHVVRTVEPPRPSTVVGDRPPTTGTSADRLRRLLAGDLDTICLTALRKEPERRYTSVEALADDLHRHRDGLPVLARPDTAGYRARKFVRRHRAGIAATTASGAVVILVAALAFARVSAERDRAATEAETSREVSAFLASLFEEADPGRALGDTLTVFAALDSGAVRLRTDLAGQPAVQARLLNTVGDIYQGLDQFDAATGAYRDALDALDRSGEDDPALRVDVLASLGAFYGSKRLLDEAEIPLTEAVRTARAHLDPADPLYSEALNRLADFYRNRTDFDQSEALFREAIDLRRRHHPGTAELADALNNFALLLAESGRTDEALRLHEEALALRRARLGPVHPMVANSLANLAHGTEAVGRYDEAVRWARQADAIHQVVYSPDHQRTLRNRRTLAEALVGLGRLGEAEPLIEEVRRGTPSEGPGATSYARACVVLAQIRRQQGRFGEAESLAAEAQRIYSDSYGPASLGTARALAERGRIALARGDAEAAQTLLKKARDNYTARTDTAHFLVREVEAILAEAGA